MVLTITLNPAIDKILILNNFEIHKLHRINEDETSLVTAGGKGVNIANNLKRLGNEVIATGFTGGHSGHMLCDAIREEGITTSFIFTSASTRTNTSILDLTNKTLTEINDVGQRIEHDDIVFFLENYKRLLKRVELVVLAGSLPLGVSESIFSELIQLAREHGKKFLVHSPSNYTETIMKKSPFLILPDMRSHHELFGKKVDGISDLLEAGRLVLADCPNTEYVIFTHRIENVVVVSREKSFIVRPRELEIVNMLGYGDAYLSGFIHAYLLKLPIIDTLEYASACGLANVENLHKEINDLDKIKANLKRVDVEEVD